MIHNPHRQRQTTAMTTEFETGTDQANIKDLEGNNYAKK